jgi:hypothetical protein
VSRFELRRPQAVSLGSTMNRVLDFVSEARKWLEVPGAVAPELGGLAPESTRRLGSLLDRLEVRARRLIAEFGLPVDNVSVRGRLRGHSSILWANLLDSQSERMRGYGPVQEWYRDKIDPSLDEMADSMREILYLAAEPGTHS